MHKLRILSLKLKVYEMRIAVHVNDNYSWKTQSMLIL